MQTTNIFCNYLITICLKLHRSVWLGSGFCLLAWVLAGFFFSLVWGIFFNGSFLLFFFFLSRQRADLLLDMEGSCDVKDNQKEPNGMQWWKKGCQKSLTAPSAHIWEEDENTKADVGYCQYTAISLSCVKTLLVIGWSGHIKNLEEQNSNHCVYSGSIENKLSGRPALQISFQKVHFTARTERSLHLLRNCPSGRQSLKSK